MMLVPGHLSDSHLSAWMLLPPGASAPNLRVRAVATQAVVDATLGPPRSLPESLSSWRWLAATFPGLAGDREYVIESQQPGAPWKDECVARTLPSSLPAEGLTFAIGSCFYKENDQGVGAALRRLAHSHRPRFKLLLGDQVYADVPWHAGSPMDRMRRDYFERYLEYWRHGSYSAWLQATPNMTTFDDHEYWNNFPERAIWLSRSSAANAPLTRAAALEALETFQTPLNPPSAGHRTWYSFEAAGIPFMVADVRSWRDAFGTTPQPGFLGSGGQLADIEGWCSGLRSPGVLVLGQPLLQSPAGSFQSRIADAALADFPEHYAAVWRAIARAPWDILVLSGDIHCGRLAVASCPVDGRVRDIHEFIASPLSLVASMPFGGSGRRGTFETIVPTRLDIAVNPAERIGPVVYETKGGTCRDNVGLITVTPDPNQPPPSRGVEVHCRLIDVATGSIAEAQDGPDGARCDWTCKLRRRF